MQLAMLCEGSGDLELAVKHYETALAFDANHTETLTRMGSVQNRVSLYPATAFVSCRCCCC